MYRAMLIVSVALSLSCAKSPALKTARLSPGPGQALANRDGLFFFVGLELVKQRSHPLAEPPYVKVGALQSVVRVSPQGEVLAIDLAKDGPSFNKNLGHVFGHGKEIMYLDYSRSKRLFYVWNEDEKRFEELDEARSAEIESELDLSSTPMRQWSSRLLAHSERSGWQLLTAHYNSDLLKVSWKGKEVGVLFESKDDEASLLISVTQDGRSGKTKILTARVEDVQRVTESE